MKLIPLFIAAWAIPSAVAAAIEPSVDWLGPLAGQGLAGAVLAWFMLRNEKRQKAVETSVDDLVRAHFALMIRLDPDSTPIKEAAEKAHQRIDAKKEQD